MKRFVVFLVGVLAIGSAAYYLRPGATGIGDDTIVARIRVQRPGQTPQEEKSLLEAEVSRIVSKEVIATAIKQGRLDNLPSMKNEAIAELLNERLKASIWPKTRNVIELRFESKSEMDGMTVLNAVIDAYVGQAQSVGVADDETEFRRLLEEWTQTCSVTLASQRNQRDELVEKAVFPILDDYGPTLEQRAEAVAARTRLLTEKEGKIAALRSRVNVIEKLREDKDEKELLSFFLLNDPQARVSIGADAIVRDLLPLFQEKKEILKRVGREHPDVLKVDRKISVVREFLGRDPRGKEETMWEFMQTYVDVLVTEAAMHEAEADMLKADDQKMKDELLAYSKFAVRERQLREAIATSERQFSTLAEQVNAFQVEKSLQIEVVETPKASQDVTEGNANWILILVGMLVLGVSMAWRATWLAKRALVGTPDSNLDPESPTILVPVADAVWKNGADCRLTVAEREAIRRVAMVVRLAKFVDDRDHAIFRSMRPESVGIAWYLAQELALDGERVEMVVEEPELLEQIRQRADETVGESRVIVSNALSADSRSNAEYHLMLGGGCIGVAEHLRTVEFQTDSREVGMNVVILRPHVESHVALTN